MAELVGYVVKSTFIADFREWVSISQAWVRMQTYSKPSAKPAIWL